jgi:molybdopterin/thiamine biosynthesis adenylyltransferase
MTKIIASPRMNTNTKPLIKRSHHIIMAEDGDICIGEIPGVSKIIVAPPEWVKDVLGKLDGTRTMPRIAKELRHQGIEVSKQDLTDFIAALHEMNLLEDNAFFSNALTSEEVERYDRQMLQFSLIDKRHVHSQIYQEHLKSSNVVMFGMGGWGTWCSLLLAMAGIGKLRLVDGDDVELSNINRQILYTTSDVGKEKVSAAKERIYEYNPNVIVETFYEFAAPDPSQISKLLEGVDLIVLAWASLGYYRKHTPEEVIHTMAKERGIPVMELGGDPLEISVGPLYLNDGSHKSFEDVKQSARQNYYSSKRNIEKFQRARLKHNFLNGDRTVNAWQSAPSLSAMAGLACDQIVKHITGYDQPTVIGKRIYLSMQTLDKREETVFEYE